MKKVKFIVAALMFFNRFQYMAFGKKKAFTNFGVQISNDNRIAENYSKVSVFNKTIFKTTQGIVINNVINKTLIGDTSNFMFNSLGTFLFKHLVKAEVCGTTVKNTKIRYSVNLDQDLTPNYGF